MTRSAVVFVLIASYCTFAAGQAPRVFTGTLDRNLSPDLVHLYQRVFLPVKKPSLYKIDPTPSVGAALYEGDVIDPRSPGKTMALVSEAVSGPSFVWIDSDRNGRYELRERTELRRTSSSPTHAALAMLPISNVRYKEYPIFLGYHADLQHPKLPTGARLVVQSVMTVAYGRATIGDREVRLQYPFSPDQPVISTTEGLFGADVDGDGSVLDAQFSAESQYVSGEEAVFPLGGTFISTANVDLTAGSVTLRERRKDEYTRIDLSVGREMPDFDFVDLDGAKRKLSHFRGKYVLVDFWGVWCSDCIRETPFHLAAYEKFRKRGFEILGINSDEKIETVRAYVAKNRIIWPQATNESTKDLREKSYKLQEYPSSVLLGPDGKVLVLDQELLLGNRLLETLDRILPR